MNNPSMKQLLTEWRKLLNESMPLSDRLYLGNLLKSYKGTFRDWSEFCDWYNDLMRDVGNRYNDIEMDDFLQRQNLLTCPASIEDLLSIIEDPDTQSHPMFSTWAHEVRTNF